ncbi:MAG TPA: EAL domain-containing protein [Acidimicrobiales bacterium]
MRSDGRPRSLSTTPLEIAATAAAFVGLHWLHLVGSLPILTVIALLGAAGAATVAAQRRWPADCSDRGLHRRLAVEMAAATVVMYAIGWGPTLALGYIVVAADDMRLCGSRAWRPAATWCVFGMAGGQIAVAVGAVPTYVATPYVHGLAVLAALAVVFVVRLLGIKTQAVEEEAGQRAAAEEGLRQSEERFRSLVQNASDVITVVDATGQVTFVSPSVERVLGFDPEIYIRGDGLRYTHEEDSARASEIMIAALADPSRDHVSELRLQHADGTWRWHEVTMRNLLDVPAVRGLVVNHRDITERKAYQDRIAHEARHDALTGLANRTAFFERLEQALARARRHRTGVAVLFVDLDRFKLINDSLGHVIGDRVIVQVARQLTEGRRAEDTVARLSGDEFTVLLEDVPDPAHAARAAERIAERLRQPVYLGDRRLVVTASVGVAVSACGTETAEELLCQADLAMYAAKEAGRARATVFDADATPQFVDRVDLEAGLRSAVDRNELVLHYQPIVDVHTREVRGFEALVRWQHPARGLLAPAHFIGVAEETGLIVPVGRWVLQEACATLAEWRAEHGRPSLTMSVNVSAVQLYQPGFAAEVADALAAHGLPAANLVLEITESILLRPEAAAEVLGQLHELGIKLAMDDFGTGYSSLAYLRRLPLDFVKIDRTFVADLGSETADVAIIRAIAELARNLGLVTVAEGVETERQAEVLDGLACHLAQGYHFARPAPREVVERILSTEVSVAG